MGDRVDNGLTVSCEQAPSAWPGGSVNIKDLVAENGRLREALNDIVNASRDDGLAAMCNWMRGRALTALMSPTTASTEASDG